MHDYAGALHFHSAYSYDACIPLPKILDEASEVGLDFVVLTDHFHMDAQQDGFEGYFASPGLRPPSPVGRGTGEAQGEARPLLVIVGEEISPRYNHYLALGLLHPVVVRKSEAKAQEIIDAVRDQGGFGFLAHPDHPGAPLVGSRACPWVDWTVHGYAGMGIWDLMSDWSSHLTSPWRTLYAVLFPEYVLRGPFPQTLARWDELAKGDHCVAIGEIDNHGGERHWLGLRRRIFPFSFAFRTIRTHVLLTEPLTQNASVDQGEILSALRSGQSYVSLDLWNDPRGFSLSIFDDRQRIWPGGTFIRQGPALLECKLPRAGRLRLIRDGRVVREERRRASLQWDVDLPGVYRIEADQRVRGRWRPWIFSNPIWVR
jgi:hypothetical protein